ncbi:DUF3618 domain-containing protein [Kutzneria sp. NPDC052558]|uniref:DUF3618 domain-containing protein n=1 Tax=Kutzneria sp. NPDC052558 TaxID=3364121 RepID=UPI0037CAAC83
MTGKPQDPAALRAEIEHTREDLADTINRLQGKVNRAHKVPIGLAVAGGLGLLLTLILLLRRR